jgi:hypothetical protein
LRVEKSRDSSDPVNNSASQYATLGLRACHDAGILIPEEVIHRAIKWWKGCQYPVGRDKAYPQIGWSYWFCGARDTEGPTGSMTAGAVGSLAIYDFMLGLDWKKDPNVGARGPVPSRIDVSPLIGRQA